MSGLAEALRGAREKLSSMRLSDLRGGMPSSPEAKKELLLFVAAFMLFALASVFTMMNYIWLTNMRASDMDSGGGRAAASPEVRAKAEAVMGKYNAYIKYKEQSERVVALSEAVGRYPVAVLPKPVVTEDLEVPETPPIVTIRALVVMGKGGAATLDIEGERPGTVMRPGSVFGGGKGRITAIDSKGVSWIWANKKYRTEL